MAQKHFQTLKATQQVFLKWPFCRKFSPVDPVVQFSSKIPHKKKKKRGGGGGGREGVQLIKNCGLGLVIMKQMVDSE